MKTIYTIDHSTRSIEQFLDLLKAYSVQTEVRDIQRKKTAKLYELTPFLKVQDGKITYPVTCCHASRG